MGSMCSSCSDAESTRTKRNDNSNDPLLQQNKKKSNGETNDSDVEDNTSTVASSAQSLDLDHLGDSLFEDLARFLRTLPPKSKQHIWEHGVKIKTPDGQKQVCSATQDKEQIIKLLCDCVIVYVKYLDRQRAPLQTKKVRPHVEEISQFIFERYHPLQRNEFELDKTYFASMLENYVQSK
jgi:hypothetical protein